MKTPGFTICDNKGFHITFENGWTVSVQFGGGNYCDNYDSKIGSEHDSRGMTSGNAEVAYWPPDGKMQRFRTSGDTVAGRYTPRQVLNLLKKVAAKPKARTAK